LVLPAFRRLRSRVGRLPVVRQLAEADYERRFAGDMLGAFRGVYDSFEAAVASSPPGKPTGFDLPEVAEFELLRSRSERVFSYDYPVLFWLRPLLAPGLTIFDFGGHVGVHFYGYQRYLSFPDDLRWVVCELPSLLVPGQKLARERAAVGLRFTANREEADGADVLLAAGVLQYVERPGLGEWLGSLARPPRHLLLNKLPLTGGTAFVTLQNGGPHFIAVHVFNREEFVTSITNRGYELVDSWEDRVHRCEVPFHPDLSVPSYSGLYFRRRD
jgi:putative methyltransferase (TIGR04325 family)